MFEIKTSSIKNDLPVIVSNYSTILFDEEPILFSGTNKYGNIILGSFVDEDDSAGFHRFFHALIDDATYSNFVHKKISYLEILKNEKTPIYVVDKKYDNSIINIFLIDFTEIPQQYIPLENSYCPQFNKEYGLEFVVSLKGKLADMKLALPSEISNIQNAFAKFLESSVKPLKTLSPSPLIYQKAYTEGSFRLNFSIDLNENSLFPLSQPLIGEYVTKYLEYCVSHLHDEANIIFKGKPISATNFTLLKDKLKSVYDSSQAKLPDNIEYVVKDELAASASSFSKITENIGMHFTGMEFLSKSGETDSPIGFIDDSYKGYYSEITQVIEEVEVSHEDDEPMDYTICIYHLNTKSRTGNAYIYNLGSDKEMSQPRITITGDDSLEGSKFTESLHLNKWIQVKAKAKRKENKFLRLTISYE